MPKVNGVPIQELCGYIGSQRPELVREAFSLFGDSFAQFRIVGAGGEEKPPQVMLWRYLRPVLGGKDLPNIAQEVGDCVSWGMRNATAYVQAIPVLNRIRQSFKDTYAPYFYGISRVQIGGGRIWGDGSVGAWAAQGVLKYGAIAANGDGVPGYSGSIARSWGKSGPPAKFVEDGKTRLVGAAANVTSVQDAAEAIRNGHPVTVASNQGFRMEASNSGFHEASGSWAHQMCLVGVDLGGDGVEPHFCLLNSWGDVHGRVKDWRTGETWPVGTLRVRFEVVDRMLKQRDSFAVSAFAGFPAQPLPPVAFSMF